ncbi:type II secretion system protein [Evansella sp. AB-rgal1]|uniref:type II secretion system protein n=1 Tax=Evansella sp. AB-rgal1 TaxID=3242696 RepID=UPI00359DB717
MKKDSGFSFIEIMISLVIFSATVSIIIPAIVKVQEERQSIREERLAEEIIQLVMYRTYVEKVPFLKEVHVKHGVTYSINVSETPNLDGLCISWEGENRREYERCLYKQKK